MEEAKKSNVGVVGDIGGTNIRLRFVLDGDSVKRDVSFYTKECTNGFAEMLTQACLKVGIKPTDVSQVILGIRGVVLEGECQTDFKGESEKGLMATFPNAKIKFMNDVEAMSLGIIHHDPSDPSILRLGRPDDKSSDDPYHSPKLLFTMGTGTGLSLILPYKGSKEPMIMPTEAWAAQLSPDT
jgi:glucokinase